VAGAGLLLDLAGNDRREALACAQGLGAMRGSGALLDFDGDDTYTLYNEEPILPSAQAPASNSSMGQGMGLGLRADLEDGHSVAGGVGLLLDGAGNDHYKRASSPRARDSSAARHSRGRIRDDTYEAVYYAQGASAHSGAGISWIARATTPTASRCNAPRAADTISPWLAVDLAGNDRYRPPPRHGRRQRKRMGFFVDLAGDDTYEITAPPAAADSSGRKLEKFGTLREDTPASASSSTPAGATPIRRGPPGEREQRRLGPRAAFSLSRIALRPRRGPRRRIPPRGPANRPLTAYPQSEFDFYRKQQSARRQYAPPWPHLPRLTRRGAQATRVEIPLPIAPSPTPPPLLENPIARFQRGRSWDFAFHGRGERYRNAPCRRGFRGRRTGMRMTIAPGAAKDSFRGQTTVTFTGEPDARHAGGAADGRAPRGASAGAGGGGQDAPAPGAMWISCRGG
jgi:hypothetical protein